MASILLLIAVIAYFKWQSHSVNKRLDNYPTWKIDPVKLAKDTDKPVSVRQRNIVEGKCDYDPVEKLTPYKRERYEFSKRMALSAKSGEYIKGNDD